MGADLRYTIVGVGLVLLYAWAAGDGERDESLYKEFLAYLGTRVFADIGSVGGLNFATLARQTQNIDLKLRLSRR